MFDAQPSGNLELYYSPLFQQETVLLRDTYIQNYHNFYNLQ